MSVVGYALGTLDVTDMIGHLSIYAAVTGLYLANIVKGHMRRRDIITIGANFAFAGGLAAVSAPSYVAVGGWRDDLYALGTGLIGVVLVILWHLYVRFIDIEDRERGAIETDGGESATDR